MYPYDWYVVYGGIVEHFERSSSSHGVGFASMACGWRQSTSLLGVCSLFWAMVNALYAELSANSLDERQLLTQVGRVRSASLGKRTTLELPISHTQNVA